VNILADVLLCVLVLWLVGGIGLAIWEKHR